MTPVERRASIVRQASDALDEYKRLRAALKAHDAHQKIRRAGTVTARVLRFLESDGEQRTLMEINAHIDPTLADYTAVISGVHNLVRYGVVRRVRHGVYRAVETYNPACKEST